MECYLLQKDLRHGQFLRRSTEDMFRKAMKKAGLPKELTFHRLRHTFATNALKRVLISTVSVKLWDTPLPWLHPNFTIAPQL